jgi:hypothetical protein
MDPSRVARILADQESSASARVLRAGLVGLRAALEDTLGRTADDPAAARVRELIGELGAVLAGPPADFGAGAASGTNVSAGAGATFGTSAASGANLSAPAGVSVSAASPRERAAEARSARLRELAAALAADPRARRFLDERSLTALAGPGGGPDADEALWSTFHLRLLRLPAQVAEDWRRRAARLVTASSGGAARTVLPDTENVLIPPYSPGGPSLVTAPDAAPDPQIAAAIGGMPIRGSDLDALAALTTCVLAVAERDDSLYLCLESVQFHGAEPLDARLTASYREEALARMSNYVHAEPGSIAQFEALILLDEAVASLVHSPLAAPDSWWAALGTASRRLLAERVRALRADGQDVEAVPLALRYRDVRDRTDGNDVGARESGSAPGEVLACLRVWARVPSRRLTGRVLYQAA